MYETTFMSKNPIDSNTTLTLIQFAMLRSQLSYLKFLTSLFYNPLSCRLYDVTLSIKWCCKIADDIHTNRTIPNVC